MKITAVDVLHCDAGWRPWSFVRISTDTGIVGWSECTESNGSPLAVEAVVRTLTPRLIGKDPREIRMRRWEMNAATRQSAGGVVAKGIGGIENCLWDIKAKDLDVPVYELLGGPVRNEVGLYWSHCGTTRVRAHHFVGEQQIRTNEDVTKLAEEVVARGYHGLKTNILLLGDDPFVYMPGFDRSPGGPDLNAEKFVIDGLRETMAAFRKGLPDGFQLIVDLNLNFKADGYVQVARMLEEFELAWLELDILNPVVLSDVRARIHQPVCSGENVIGTKEYLPLLHKNALDIASIDILWNGMTQSLEIAQLADIYSINVTPHNYYSHLATFIAAHFCAATPNLRLLEIDIDDVPWRDDIVTELPTITNGYLRVPSGPGWGTAIVEDALHKHPWSGT